MIPYSLNLENYDKISTVVKKFQFLLRLIASACSVLLHFAQSVIFLTILE